MDKSQQPKTTADLDALKCSDPHCTNDGHPIVLSPRCHPGAGQKVAYVADKSALQISCATCDRFICNVAVATVH